MTKVRRSDYWNVDYYNYWLARVQEANSQNSVNSNVCRRDFITTGDKEYFADIDLLDINNEDFVLEVGCGFGRSIPYLYQKTKKVFGIDISDAMIKHAQKTCKHFPNVLLEVCEAEKTNFKNKYFDKIICYGVFDALQQVDALIEFNRLLKLQGHVLITGKNNNYFVDDELALLAENNAFLKNHPNFFTDVRYLLNNIYKFGFTVCKSKFFLRRGDTAKGKYLTDLPENFYQFTLTLKKISEPYDNVSDLIISAQHSLTFKNTN